MVSINRQVILLLLFMLVVITLVSCWTGRRLDGLPDGASSIIVPLTKEETPFKDALGPTAHIGSVKPKYHVQPVQISLPFFDHPSAELLPRLRASYWTPYCWFPIAQPIEIRGGSNPMAVVRSHHFGGYANWGVTEFKADSGAWCLRLMPKPGLEISENAKTAARILVLVHGEWADPAFWDELLKNMEGKLPGDIAVAHMHWPQGSRIADSGGLLFDELNRLGEINPSAEVHIVSHSIGGLVARYALESKPRPQAKVVSLTMFAPPNQGSGWARVRSDDAGGTRTVIEDLMMKYDMPEISLRETLASLYMFKDGTGAAMEDLDPKSDFLANLNRDWKGPPEGVEYRIIAGLALSYWNMLHEKSYFEDETLDEIRGDWIVSEKSAALPGMAPILLPYPHFHIQDTVDAAVEILRTIGVAAKFEEVAILLGHTSEVSSVAFSPDGKAIVSGSWDGTVRLWDLATKSCRKTLLGHTDTVASVAFGLDGKTVISGGSDATVRVWDSATAESLRVLVGHTAGVNTVALSPDGKTIASGSDDHSVRLWDAETGICTQTLMGHSGGVLSVVFSADGKTIASGSHDHTVRLWIVKSGESFRTMTGHNGGVYSVAFNPDGRVVASGSNDNTLRLWSSETGESLLKRESGDYAVRSVVFTPDGTIVVGATKSTLQFWETASGTLTKSIEIPMGYGSDKSVVFSPDGKSVAAGAGGPSVRLWRLDEK